MTYKDAAAKLTGRNSQRRKVGNNTYLERRDDNTIALRLHNTDIITFYSNGDVELFSGGYRTVTTKARMNEFMPYGFSISQSKGQWYVGRYAEGEGWQTLCLFEDNMELHEDGTFHGGSPVEDAKKALKLRRQVKEYSKAYVKALRAGKVKAPSTGDCWYCLTRETTGEGTKYGVLHSDSRLTNEATVKPGITGRTMGEIEHSDHILQHIKDKYFVPSLLLRAFEVFPTSIAMKDQVQRIWDGDLSTSWGEFIFDQIAKNIYRYCLRQLGQAS